MNKLTGPEALCSFTLNARTIIVSIATLKGMGVTQCWICQIKSHDSGNRSNNNTIVLGWRQFFDKTLGSLEKVPYRGIWTTFTIGIFNDVIFYAEKVLF